jgi:hypothetical protein
MRAFRPYINRETNDVVIALELTDPLIRIMENTLGLEALANVSAPGDFVIGFECRVVTGEEFRENYRPLPASEEA